MRRRRLAQRGQAVAAFKARYHAALRVLARDIDKLACDPLVVGCAEVEVGERVEIVRIEPGRDHHELRAKALDRWQDDVAADLAERERTRRGRQRRVDDVADAGFVRFAAAGIQRRLMRGGVEYAWLTPEDVLRAVAVVH